MTGAHHSDGLLIMIMIRKKNDETLTKTLIPYFTAAHTSIAYIWAGRTHVRTPPPPFPVNWLELRVSCKLAFEMMNARGNRIKAKKN